MRKGFASLLPPAPKRNEPEVLSAAGIKVEAGYPAYERGLQAGVFVRYPDGTPVLGQVWPGPVHYPDFVMHGPTGDYWQEQLAKFHQVSNAGLRSCVLSISTVSYLVLLVFGLAWPDYFASRFCRLSEA
jgi:hypothetical protein